MDSGFLGVQSESNAEIYAEIVEETKMKSKSAWKERLMCLVLMFIIDHDQSHMNNVLIT